MAEGDIVATGLSNAIGQPWAARAVRSVPGADRRLVIISNRVAADSGKPDSGGLAVAIRAALENHGGMWFGWSGEVDDEAGDAPARVERGPFTYATLNLSQRDYNEYYLGFANRVLWPLFHFRGSLVDYSRQDFAGYLRVNRKFARSLAPMLVPQDLVWVHDYHLIPLGRELRRLDCSQPIGFFLHTPFPPAELLRVLPNHRDLVEALCAYDLVGFQTKSDLHGFSDYLLRLRRRRRPRTRCTASFRPDRARSGFSDRDRRCHLRSAGDSRRRDPPDAAAGQSLGKRTLMIGVDRLDYSKGLPARFAGLRATARRPIPKPAATSFSCR